MRTAPGGRAEAILDHSPVPVSGVGEPRRKVRSPPPVLQCGDPVSGVAEPSSTTGMVGAVLQCEPGGIAGESRKAATGARERKGLQW